MIAKKIRPLPNVNDRLTSPHCLIFRRIKVTNNLETSFLFFNENPLLQSNFLHTGNGLEDQLPTVAIVTHYDAYGVVPTLSHGVDSTGSGVVAMLELVRIFSKLFEKSRTHPKYNMLFLLAGGGKFNYQGKLSRRS